MMAEIYGKATGSCKGKGGSMHIADLSKGMMGANGILGAGAPLACGAALAAKYRKDGGVGISFFGDGASNQGMFLESLNLAAVWNLPAIFVVENNGYAESTSRDYATAVDSYVDRAAGFGLPGVTVDGTDFFAVYEAAGEIIKRAREGGGPSLLECKMIRFYGHFEGDQQTYRAKDEVENLRASKDCIKLLRCPGHRRRSRQASRSRQDRWRSWQADRARRGRGQGGTAADGQGPDDGRLRFVLRGTVGRDRRSPLSGYDFQHRPERPCPEMGRPPVAPTASQFRRTPPNGT